MRGRYPAIFDDARFGDKARELWEDARALLQEIVARRLITARAAYGFFPANSVGDDIEVYGDESRQQVVVHFRCLRQQNEKPEGQFQFGGTWRRGEIHEVLSWIRQRPLRDPLQLQEFRGSHDAAGAGEESQDDFGSDGRHAEGVELVAILRHGKSIFMVAGRPIRAAIGYGCARKAEWNG